MLVRHAGFWSLVVCSLELLFLLGLLHHRTHLSFFNRWLHRISWILSVALYLACRIGDKIPPTRAIHTFDEYYLALGRIFVRQAEIKAALWMPILALLIIFLASLPRLIATVRVKFSRHAFGVQ